MSNVYVGSEIHTLKKVIIHTPGLELELMTPETAAEVLYDDILNLKNAREQHLQLSLVLEKVAKPFQVVDLLKDILNDENVKYELLNEICLKLNVQEHFKNLFNLPNERLAEKLITGTEIKRDTLERYLSPNHYAIPPLPNLFFTRDSAMVVNQHVLIGNMATDVRTTESVLMSYMFSYHPELNCQENLIDTTLLNMPGKTFEGGDILILREDVLAIGMSERTSTSGIDYLIEHFKKEGKAKHIFVVMLPKHRALIHLDMVFTMIDRDKAVIFPEMIADRNAVDVIHIDITKPEKPVFSRHDFLLEALKTVGIKLEPIYCGGKARAMAIRCQFLYYCTR